MLPTNIDAGSNNFAQVLKRLQDLEDRYSKLSRIEVPRKTEIDAILDVHRVYVTRTSAVNSIAATLEYFTFENEIYDTDAMWGAGAPTRVTFTTAGVYVVSAYIQWSSGTAGTYRHGGIYINGGTVSANTLAAETISVVAGTISQLAIASVPYPFSATDYIQLGHRAGETKQVGIARLSAYRIA